MSKLDFDHKPNQIFSSRTLKKLEEAKLPVPNVTRPSDVFKVVMAEAESKILDQQKGVGSELPSSIE